MDVTNFDDAEIPQPGDLTAISTRARSALDSVIEGGFGWPAHWSRFAVETTDDPNTVGITPGDYYEGSAVYKQDERVLLNLLTLKPIVSSDEVWVALILRHRDETVDEIRSFETSDEPLTESIVVNQSTPKVERRVVDVATQVGPVGPPPQNRPAIAQDDCAIAMVRLTTAGVQSIEAFESDRVKTVYEIEGRVSVLEVVVEELRQVTETLRTDLAGVAAQQERAPSRALVSQLARDVAITRQRLEMGDEYRNYWFSDGLIDDDINLAHAQSAVRIDEGFRYPPALERDHILRLLNPSNNDVMTYDNIKVTPAHTEVKRHALEPGNSSENISNTVHTITTAVQVTTSHTRIRYGETIYPCENTAGWERLGSQRAGATFAVNGQQFVSRGLSSNAWNNDPASVGHKNYAVQRIIRDTVPVTYTRYDTKEVGLSGAIYWQSFPVSQFSIIVGVNIYFKSVGATGDVTLCLTQLNTDGTPDFDAVIAVSQLAHGDLAEGWVRFPIDLAVLEPGEQYAWFTVTAGNHEIAMSTDNAFPEGTSGKSTDGVWSQGSIMNDYSFELIAAKFTQNRTVVPMEALTLSGGMSQIDMVYQSAEPGTARLIYQIKAQGDADWRDLDANPDNPLANLPSLVELRAVFLGTPDVAPVLTLDDNARVLASRLQGAMRAITDPIQFGYSGTEIQAVVQMDNYDDSVHTCTPTLIVDGASVAPISVTSQVDRDKPSRTKFVANFVLGSAASAAAISVASTATEVTFVPFGQDFHLITF